MQSSTGNGPAITSDDPHIFQLKIMYWGPGESGKTTNFTRLKEIFVEHRISDGFSIETTDHRTLWNDAVMFEFDVPAIKALLYVQITTTTGQERFLTTREYVLQNADGVIFVADSNPQKMADNQRSFQELLAFTQDTGIPILIQLNKRDLPNGISVMAFKRALGLPEADTDGFGFPIVYEAIAANELEPEGVKESLLDMLQKILFKKLDKK